MPPEQLRLSPGDTAHARFFYGWVVVGSAHVLLALSFGTAYAFGTFFGHIQASFAAGRGGVASIFSITAFIYYAVGALSGHLADRFPAKLIIAVGIVLMALGEGLASLATSFDQVLIAFAAGIGVGVGLVHVPAIRAIQPWFVVSRSRATGIVVAGTGVGTLVLPLLASALLAAMEWRDAMRVMALLVLVLGITSSMLLDRDPQARGLAPDGLQPEEKPARGMGNSEGRSTTFREAVATRAFWLLFAIILLASIGLFVAMVHVAPFARDHGMSEGTGALMLGLIGIGNILGRFALAGLGDRADRLRLLGLCALGMGLALIFWLAVTNAVMLAIFAVAFGACCGGSIALYPLITGDRFGIAHLGSIIGTLYVAVGVAALIGPSLAGVLFDAWHSYAVPIVASAACAFGSAFLIFAVLAEAE